MININTSSKNTFTDYGKTVKKQLIDNDKSQSWLIEELKKKTGMFVDSSLLNKILTGKVKSEKLISTINEILKITIKD